MNNEPVFVPAKTIVLVYGLPGAGKTELSKRLQALFQSSWFNADTVRQTLSKDLGFTQEDRIEQARRLACLAALTLKHGAANVCVVDFVNPTTVTYATFQENLRLPKGKQPRNELALVPESFAQATQDPDFPDYNLFSVYMNTIEPSQSRFPDTASLFQPALGVRQPNLVISDFIDTERGWNEIAGIIYKNVRGVSPQSWPRMVEYKSGKLLAITPPLA